MTLMIKSSVNNPCAHSETTCAYAAQALPAAETDAAAAHIASCADCQRELEGLRLIIDSFVAWPTDVLRPTTSLHERLAQRIAADGEANGTNEADAARIAASSWVEPPWEEVAPGIECKLLATDQERARVSMLVRLAAGARYPAHTHAGVEELHLLDGELWIDGKKLVPGDYNYGAAGAGDEHVWSEGGCTCVLVTSFKDVLR
jgi:anti-sigma factor ChrR (cupin superfamily)